MPRHFNTTGPVFPGKHYCVDPLQRIDWAEVQHLIDSEKYFILHAPRQTGKTSTLLAIMKGLDQEEKYSTLYVNIEAAQAARDDAESGLAIVCETIAATATTYNVEPRLEKLTRELLANSQARGALTTLLSRWAQMSDKPIVLMLDEVDALIGDTLISLLRQIRAGYAQRPAAFPQSIILCGVRDIRDYRIHSHHKETITGGSAFNIKAESLRMNNLNQNEVGLLYKQHTEETGQIFTADLFSALWQDTQGQPWLANALGHEMTWKDQAARNRNTPITIECYRAARERLIRSRATHLDQLTHKLKEARVHTVIAAILAGEPSIPAMQEDDLQYVEDLGLITRKPHLRIANAIYQEIIPREITAPIQDAIAPDPSWYVTPNKHLDMSKLLSQFQQFFRENADIWLQGLPYKEAGPQLILQAFLQRILNGGGRIHREYALGRKYTDLYIEWPVDEVQGFYGEVQRIVLELKILYSNLEQTIDDGVAQATAYAHQCGATEVHLLIFNRNAQVSWDDRIWHHNRPRNEPLTVDVWGC